MTPPLPRREQRELAEQHMPLVRHIAHKLRSHLPPDLELDDLVSWGTQGMLEAAERFDPSRGLAFSTYAYYRIKGGMYDGLRASSRLPRSEYSKLRLLEGADDYLENAAAREGGADPAALARRSTADTLEQLSSHLGAVTTVYLFSLDAQTHGEIPDSEAVAEFDRLDTLGFSPHLEPALAELDDRERQLVRLCYFKDCSLREAGEQLGVSRSWASRIHSRAIRKMQSYFAARDKAMDTPHAGSPDVPEP